MGVEGSGGGRAEVDRGLGTREMRSPGEWARTAGGGEHRGCSFNSS